MQPNDHLIEAVRLATRKLSGSGDFDSLLKDVLAICVEAVGAEGGTIYLHDPVRKCLVFQHVLPEDVAGKLSGKIITDDFGVVGKAFHARSTIVTDRQTEEPQHGNAIEEDTGVPVRSMVTTPLTVGLEVPVGVVQVINKIDGSFGENDVAVLDTVASVSTMAYLNSKLIEQQFRASSLLGMGKVGHDIGNLAASLYANISFSELAMAGLKEHLAKVQVEDTITMYVEALDGMFDDLRSSIDRIVGYSRLISDLSAGRQLRPNKKLAAMSETIQTSAAYLETEGRRNHVALVYDIDSNAPPLLHDELYVFRIVQNLVGNAIKAVRETIPQEWLDSVGEQDDAIFGEVGVRYHFEADQHIIEVKDTGPGMSKAIADRILAGNARSQWDKATGSGWGTKIVLELATTHDGRVEIESEPGQGALFRVIFPHRTE